MLDAALLGQYQLTPVLVEIIVLLAQIVIRLCSITPASLGLRGLDGQTPLKRSAALY